MIRPDDARRRLLLLQRDAGAPSLARAWLREQLDLPPGPDVDGAMLVVTELVTNAMRHGLGQVTVRASRADDGALHLAVTDAADELPAMRTADPLGPGGHGLQIVDHLASRWGVAPFPGGKTVWAELFGGTPPS